MCLGLMVGSTEPYLPESRGRDAAPVHSRGLNKVFGNIILPLE